MLNDNNGVNDNRQLPDVFKELQQKRSEYESINNHQMHNSRANFSNGITTYVSSNKKQKVQKIQNNQNANRRNSFRQRRVSSGRPRLKHMSYTNIAILFCVLAIVASFVLLSISYNFTTYGKEEVQPSSIVTYEGNNNAIDLTKIISSNVSDSKIKETVNEERVVEFSIKYQASANLPKGEQSVVQAGVNGKSQIVAVRSYENNEIVEENIVQTTVLEEPVQQIVDVGTSEYLLEYGIHIGEYMYVTANTVLKASVNATSKDLVTIPQYYDVKLLELADDFCKVSYGGEEGYVAKSALTTPKKTTNIVQLSRIAKAKQDISITMDVNIKSGLTLDDFKKALTGNSQDTNKIFENNYQAFYDAEQKYNINGIFLAAMAIHESAWGTSQISQDKKNLFGYGAYDRDPYNSSYEFEDYADGIDLVAKVLAKYYVNPEGTVIYDNEKATATYYNGSKLEDVNKKYSTDSTWYTKVYSYMELLYNRV